jgi:hypothetical protein
VLFRPRLRGLWAILALCTLAAPWWNVPRDQADSAGMLAHLHAFFVDADLLYDDEYAALGMSPLFAFVTDEGVVSNHWPAGATWLQAPGWALGWLAARVLAMLGIGRGDPMGVVAVLGLRAWAMLALVGIAWGVARLIAAAQHDAGSQGATRAGWGVAAAFVLGTPLYYYAADAPLRPHLWGAALTLALVGLWWRPELGSPRSRTLALALLAGLATYVRPQLGPLVLLVAHDAWSGPQRMQRLLLGAATFTAFVLAHLRVQRWMYGDQLGDYGDAVTHHLGAFLLSTHHGVLPWCPVLLLALVAMLRASALRERGAWLLLALVAWQLWIDSGMRAIEPRAVIGTRTWSGGLSFGPRKLVDVLPLLLPATASLVAAARRRGHGLALAVVAGLACTPTLLLHASAWIDPDATTGGIMGAGEYRAALVRPLSSDAWARAWAQRSVPWLVPVIVTLVVVLPLGLAGAWAWRAARRRASAEDPLRPAGVVAVGCLLVVHGWLAVLLLRSDGARDDDPQRMTDAAARMTPAHYAIVRRIQAHHAELRARLGPDAAPPDG